jgi:hypothetical protein
MATLTDLPNEIKIFICEYLAGTSGLQALALVCKDTSHCALEVYSKNKVIDLRSGDAQVCDALFARLFSSASQAAQPPTCTFRSTGHVLTDRIIQFASPYKTLRIRLYDRHGIRAPVTDQQLQQYMSIVPHLKPRTRESAKFWECQFKRGIIGYYLQFLLKITQHLTTLELDGSLLWMIQIDTRGTFAGLHTLRLVGLGKHALSRECAYFINLPSLRTLEFASMTIEPDTIQHMDAHSSITSLHFVDCHVAQDALTIILAACGPLETFEYSLNGAVWASELSRPWGYKMAKAIYDLRRHSTTLKHLSLRILRAQVRNMCHYVEGLAQLTALETLSMEYDHIHSVQHHISDRLCNERYARQLCNEEYELQREMNRFVGHHEVPPTPVELLSSLPNSLQRLELHNCDESIRGIWADVEQEVSTTGRLSNLITVHCSPLGTLRDIR